MSTRISILPSDCVQLIFDRIPNHYLLLHIRRVSRSWQHHQQLNCRARKSLIIVQGEEALVGFIAQNYIQPFVVHSIDHNGNPCNNRFLMELYAIFISPNKNPKIKLLIEAFPNLHTLSVLIEIISSPYLQSFTELITRYSSKLVTLRLYFIACVESYRGKKSFVSKLMGNLFNQFNLLTSLQHLSVNFEYDDWRFMNEINPQIEEPKFLTRIKEIYFKFNRSLCSGMLDWVRKYDKAGQLDQLEQFYLSDAHWKLWEEFENPKRLANLCSFLPNSLHDVDEEFMKGIVTKFPSLITISIILGDNLNSLDKLSTILSPLTKLVHLLLNINSLTLNKPLNPNSTLQLKSLKALDYFTDSNNFNIKQFLQDSSQTHVPTIVHCFPNLQSIRIKTLHRNSFDAQQKLEGNVEQFFGRLKVAFGKESLRTAYIASSKLY